MQHFSLTDEQPSTSLNRCLESAEAGPPPAAGLASSHPQSPPVSAEQSPSPPTVQASVSTVFQFTVSAVSLLLPNSGNGLMMANMRLTSSLLIVVVLGKLHISDVWRCSASPFRALSNIADMSAYDRTDSPIIGFLCLWQQLLLTTVACVQRTGNYWTR